MKLLFFRASPRLFTQTGFDAILKKLKVHFIDLKTYPSEMAFENVALFLTCCLLNLFATNKTNQATRAIDDVSNLLPS